MERAGTAAGWALFFHLPLISGSSIGIGIGSNYSNLPELSILLCKTELQCGDRLCLSKWLCCHYKGTVAQTTCPSNSVLNSSQQITSKVTLSSGKECLRMTGVKNGGFCKKNPSSTTHQSFLRSYSCTFQSAAPLNKSTASSEFPSYEENGNDSSLLVSPLLVAGVVIGLVLLLSCATIVVGSLRKDGRLRHPQLSSEPGYAPDGFSHGGSSGELRSTCTEEFPQACDFGSYLDILSQVSIMYPDPPPRYDECVGPGATQIYIPTDDPPPYSLMDPCQRNEISINIYISQEEEAAAGTTGQAANSAVRLQDLQQPLPSISVISHSGGCTPVQVSGV